MGNCVEHISYHCVLFSYTLLLPGTPKSGDITGTLLLLFFQNGSNGAEITFHNSIIRNFIVAKICLKQIYCS